MQPNSVLHLAQITSFHEFSSTKCFLFRCNGAKHQIVIYSTSQLTIQSRNASLIHRLTGQIRRRRVETKKPPGSKQIKCHFT